MSLRRGTSKAKSTAMSSDKDNSRERLLVTPNSHRYGIGGGTGLYVLIRI
jgi:hypothetical protein